MSSLNSTDEWSASPRARKKFVNLKCDYLSMSDGTHDGGCNSMEMLWYFRIQANAAMRKNTEPRQDQ